MTSVLQSVILPTKQLWQRKGASINQKTRLNEGIRASMLRIIDEDGGSLGVMSRQEALDMARSRELDRIEVSPNANPPVCKIVDWCRYNYQRPKQLQKKKSTAQNPTLNQIRLGTECENQSL